MGANGLKCDRCIHHEACLRQAEFSKSELNSFKCGFYERDYTTDFPVEALESIFIQARAGADYFKDNQCAFVWFSRIQILADSLKADLTGAKLSEQTLSNPIYLRQQANI